MTHTHTQTHTHTHTHRGRWGQRKSASEWVDRGGTERGRVTARQEVS